MIRCHLHSAATISYNSSMTKTPPPAIDVRKLEQGKAAMGFDPRAVLSADQRKRDAKKASGKPEGTDNG